MRRFVHWLVLVAVLVAGWLATSPDAHAQYPVAVTPVQPVVPAVVGYTAERRGLFGWRVVYRPVVAPVAAAIPVTTSVPVAAPVTVARPIIESSAVIGYPVTTAPVTSYYAPPLAVAPPVTVARPAIVAPPVTVAPPISTYRVPTPVIVPYIGY